MTMETSFPKPRDRGAKHNLVAWVTYGTFFPSKAKQKSAHDKEREKEIRKKGKENKNKNK
jgi:hypothetical protein